MPICTNVQHGQYFPSSSSSSPPRDQSNTARGVCACPPPLPLPHVPCLASARVRSAVRVGVAVGLGVAALRARAAALRLPLAGVLRLLGRRPLLSPPLGAPVLEPHLREDANNNSNKQVFNRGVFTPPSVPTGGAIEGLSQIRQEERQWLSDCHLLHFSDVSERKKNFIYPTGWTFTEAACWEMTWCSCSFMEIIHRGIFTVLLFSI